MEEDKKLNIGKEQIHEIKMTTEEKDLMLKSILGSQKSTGKIKSPYAFSSFIFKNHFMYYGLVSCLVLVLGGGMVFASGSSLPGSALYPLKVRLVEPVKGALLFSPEAKISYQNELAVSRLVEAETLLSVNKLDERKEKELSSLLRKHTETLNLAIDEYQESKSANEDANNEFVTNFQATMGAHAQILDILTENQAKDKEDKREKRAKPSVSGTAKDSARKVQHALKNEEQKTEKHQQKKEKVQSLIDSTSAGTAQNIDTSKEKQTIIDSTKKTLNQAQQYLSEGDEEEKKGDSKKAYERILESESSAKEAKFLLDAGLQINLNRKSEESTDKREDRDENRREDRRDRGLLKLKI